MTPSEQLTEVLTGRAKPGTLRGIEFDPARQMIAAAYLNRIDKGLSCDLGGIRADLIMDDRPTGAAMEIIKPYLEIFPTIDNLTPAQEGDRGLQGKYGGLNLVDIREAIENPREQIWLVNGLIEDETTGAIFGASTAGKSFVAVDLAASIATGHSWQGGDVVRQGVVIYCAGEGRHGIPRRVKAWESHNDTQIPAGHFYLPDARVEFNRAGAIAVIEAIEDLEEPPVLIVIDTVARSLPAGADENSALHMMEFINHIDGIRDRFGCTVVLVHHTGHGQDSQNRARGSSSFRAAMDWELLVDKSKSCTTWTKQKDSELPSGMSFELVQVGDSAVLQYTGTTMKGPDLSRNEQLGINSLTETCEQLGRSYASVNEWRDNFYRRHTGDSAGAKRTAFHRVREALATKGLVIVDNDTYKPCVTSVTKALHVTPVTVGGRALQALHTPKGVTLSRPQQPLVEEIDW